MKLVSYFPNVGMRAHLKTHFNLAKRCFVDTQQQNQSTAGVHEHYDNAVTGERIESRTQLGFIEVPISNTYLVGPDNGGSAILIDPGCFDVTLLELIEENKFYISEVLITNNQDNSVQGLNTLLKIYNASITAGRSSVNDHRARKVHHGYTGMVGDIEYEVLSIEGHFDDSRIYKIGPFLFTGDTVSAGRFSQSTSPYSYDIFCESIKEKIFTLNDDLILLPGHGPPTTIGAERKFNINLQARMD